MEQVTVTFPDKQLAQEFMSWLNGQGEQDMWMWMECRDLPKEVGQPVYDSQKQTIHIPYRD